MQPDPEVAGAKAKKLTETLGINLLKLAKHEGLGQRARQPAQTPIENTPEFVAFQRLLGAFPGRRRV